MSLVLDNSLAMAWCFEDERTPAAMGLLDRVAEDVAHAPVFWPLEAANVLLMAERRGRLDAEGRERRARFFLDLPIALDPETGERAWRGTTALARRHRMTTYDATYLELAIRLAVPLATLDKRMRAAATADGVPLLGL